ncbi:MAG: DoxX family membrane protein [Vicinamibacteraceae bacterium]
MIDRADAWKLGARVYGAAAMAFGLIGLTWGEFSIVFQPVPDSLPHRTALAYVVAACLLAGGAAIQVRRIARPGLVVVTALYFMFAMGWARRVVLYPHIFSTWNGCAEQIALAAAGVIAYAAVAPGGPTWTIRAAEPARVLFAICALSFGVEHFYEFAQTANMVPAWLPPGQRFWAATTGVAHLLAGTAILSGVLGVLAARLLTLMFVIFGALVWAPALFGAPQQHFVWTANAVNLAAAGAAWVVADWLSSGVHAEMAARDGAGHV